MSTSVPTSVQISVPIIDDQHDVFVKFGLEFLKYGVSPDFIKSIEFQGFDSAVTVTTLIKNHIASYGQFNKDAFANDMMKLCAICLMRGTKISKMVEKMSVEGRSDIDRLVRIYKIQSTDPKAHPLRTTITLSRVSACFPMNAAAIILSGRVEVENGIPALPDFLAFPSGGALIPSHSGFGSYRSAWRKWTNTFSRKIKAKSSVSMMRMLLTCGDKLVRCQMWNICALMLLEAKGSVLKISDGTKPIDMPTNPTIKMMCEAVKNEDEGDDEEEDDDDMDEDEDTTETSKKRKAV